MVKEHSTSTRMLLLQMGRALDKLRIEKGWNQAEFARQATLHMPKGSGRTIGRDSMGGYIKGRNVPDLIAQKAIAAALGVKPEKIFHPFLNGVDVMPRIPPQTEHFGDGTANIRINMILPSETVSKIIRLVEQGQEQMKGRKHAS
jgi:transcriptional regulator with XRE-family HTH domain